MKKTKSTRRLNLNLETLRAMQLQEVTGGTILVASKPQASCFIQCVTRQCPTERGCELASAHC
jgi:hypothetical protein